MTVEPHDPASTPPSTTPGDTPTAAPPANQDGRPGLNRIWAIALASGLVAGLLAWGAGELTRGIFEARKFKVQVLLQTFIQTTTQSQKAADLKNATLAFAILGTATGLALGLGGGLAGRSWPRALTAGVGLGAIGGLLTALATMALLSLASRSWIPDPNDLITPLLIHSGIALIVGAAGGAAFGLGLGRLRGLPRIVEFACLGAILGTVLFHLLGAAILRDTDTLSRNFQGLIYIQNTESINPGSATPSALDDSTVVRLLARLLIPVLVGGGAAWGATSRGVSAAKPRPRPADL